MVAGDGIRKRNLDTIVVRITPISNSANLFVLAELDVVCHRHQLERFVASAMFEISKPPNIPEMDHLGLRIINTIGILSSRLAWHSKEGVPILESSTDPELVVLYQRENFFVGRGILGADNRELHVTLHQPRNESPE